MDKDFELHCNIFHSLKVLKVFAKANRVISREGQNKVLNEYSTVHWYVSNIWSIQYTSTISSWITNHSVVHATCEKMRTLCPSSRTFFNIFSSRTSFPEARVRAAVSKLPLALLGAS